MKREKQQRDDGIVRLSHRPIDYQNLSGNKKKELQRDLLSALGPFFDSLKEEDVP